MVDLFYFVVYNVTINKQQKTYEVRIMKINIFLDMDGVLAHYPQDMVDKMNDKDFFINLKAMDNNIRLANELIKNDGVEVYILSSIMETSYYAVDEKHAWLDKYLPNIPVKNRFFVTFPETKNDYICRHIPDINESMNVLLDDYTVNLNNWEDEGFLPVKMLNGENNTKGTWLAKNPDLFLDVSYNPCHNYNRLMKIINHKYAI